MTVCDLVKGANNAATVELTLPAKGKITARITFPGERDALPPAAAVGLFVVTLDPKADARKPVKLRGVFPRGWCR